MADSSAGDPLPEAARALAAARGLLMDDSTAHVVTDLRRRGVRPILLKGQAIARWLYQQSEVRGSKDIDLLIAPDQFPQAEQVLRENGFERFPVAGIDHADTWTKGEDPLVVELHRRLDGVLAEPAVAWSWLSEDTDTLAVGSVEVESLGEPARALHVALHAAQHGRDARKPLNDLERALAKVDLETWSAASELARRLNAVEGLSAGLSLLDEGRSVVARLGLPAEISPRTALMSENPPLLAPGLARVAAAKGFGAKARMLARKLFPEPTYMRMWSGLARRGPLGLALSYAFRPVWILWRAGPAFRAWRAAKRKARERSAGRSD